jgi:hypothetical protein
VERGKQTMVSMYVVLLLVNTHGGHAVQIVSVPSEISADHSLVIGLAQDNSGYVTKQIIAGSCGWAETRINRALLLLLQEGMVWVDDQCEHRRYYFPSLF